MEKFTCSPPGGDGRGDGAWVSQIITMLGASREGQRERGRGRGRGRSSGGQQGETAREGEKN